MTTHTTSLPIAKRLKELGVKQESYFYHIFHNEKWLVENDETFETIDGEWACCCEVKDLEHYSAFLASELGELLPMHSDISVYREDGDEELGMIGSFWCCELPSNNFQPHEFYTREKTMADALGKMLIHLLEQGIITLPKEI